jgi:hypothetical protein
MTNYERSNDDNEIKQALVRDELVDHYLNERDMSYDELVAELERLGGRLIFHDSERLAQITGTFPGGTTVEFSEQSIPGQYQAGIIIEDTFLVPLANIDRPQNIYRPQLCATIQDEHGAIDTLLFPIAKRSDDRIEVTGLRTNEIE